MSKQLKPIRITATRGADDTPIFYAIFEDGSLAMYSHQYGWTPVKPYVPNQSKELSNESQ